ncbi:MAG: hypothetical protein IPN89_07695 [Saprospiraceae bacterium]|nr:hypothetical protein [Saprospiraceae bacterium]
MAINVFKIALSKLGLLIITISISLSVFSLNAQNSTVGGLVWFDQNADGNINNLEAGLSNVPVFLITCSGQFINAVLTQPDGSFTFNNINPGNYKFFVNKSNLPSNYVFTQYGPLTDNNILPNGYTTCQILDGSDEYVVNAGLTALSTVGDKVWTDLNANGLQDVNEPPLAGVLVNLHRASDGHIVSQTSSDLHGHYVLQNIFPDNYYIRYLPPANFQSTGRNLTDLTLNSDITDANGPFTTDNFAINAGVDNLDIDAGFYQCATICGSVFYDVNFNDTLNVFENGINGLRVNLWRITGTDTSIYTHVNTGAKPNSPSDDGYYAFCVPPGQYFIEVKVNLNSGMVASEPFKAAIPANSSQITHTFGANTTQTFMAISGGNYCEKNQGFHCTASITSRVWLDEEANGIQNNGEQGLSGITALLYDQQNRFITWSITDYNGVCVFDSLASGQYYVHFIMADGSNFSPAHQGDEIADSDVDGTYGTGTTNLITLGSCQYMLHIDAGVLNRALPVQWGEVSASKLDRNKNKIQWELLSESNVSHYNIYRGTEYQTYQWTAIGRVDSDKNKSGIYHFLDENAPTALSYYKIAAIDFDGRINYSPVLKINMDVLSSFMTLAPNPVSDILEVNFNDTVTPDLYDVGFISIYDAHGRELLHTGKLNDQKQLLSVADLPDGMYRCVYFVGGSIHHSKTFIIAR